MKHLYAVGQVVGKLFASFIAVAILLSIRRRAAA